MICTAFSRTRNQQTVQTPLLVEEDPAHGLNDDNIDPGHSNTDQIGSWHDDGVGQYFSTGGGVAQVKGGQRTSNANAFFVGGGGKLINIGNPNIGWNGWK